MIEVIVNRQYHSTLLDKTFDERKDAENAESLHEYHALYSMEMDNCIALTENFCSYADATCGHSDMLSQFKQYEKAIKYAGIFDLGYVRDHCQSTVNQDLKPIFNLHLQEYRLRMLFRSTTADHASLVYEFIEKHYPELYSTIFHNINYTPDSGLIAIYGKLSGTGEMIWTCPLYHLEKLFNNFNKTVNMLLGPMENKQ